MKVRLANCASSAQFPVMSKLHACLAVSAWLATSVALAACENRYREHEPKTAPPPAASSVPRQPPLLSVPANDLKWDKPGVSDKQRQADAESCYTFARATIEHDIRIDRDRTTGLLDQDRGYGDVTLRQRMRRFSHGSQQTRLMNDCMTRKGYQRTR